MDAVTQSRTASIINIIAGIWLMIAPSALNYTVQAVRTNSIWVGLAVAIIALIRAITPRQTIWLSWINLILGAWLVISPFIFGYLPTQMWNSVTLGIIVGGMAIWNIAEASSFNHGAHA